MKPQTFKFVGELKFLKLMMEDLKGFYAFDEDSEPEEGRVLAQGHNLSAKEKKEYFAELGYYHQGCDAYDKIFKLPSQYLEGLVFAIEQLKDKYWTPEEFSEGTYVVFLKDYGGSKKGDIDYIVNSKAEGNFTLMQLKNERTCNKRPDTVKWFVTEEEAEKFSKSLLFNFRVGKWYKITNCEATYYVKLGRISGGLLNDCEYIYKYFTSCGAFSINEIKAQEELIDLSEIQQYLPDGHVDKVYIPKEGEYAVSNYEGQGDYIFLATEDLDDCYYINKNRFNSWGEMTKANGFETYRPATEEEKLWLDVCIAANKFISKEVALLPTFKVGDWVITTTETRSFVYKPQKGEIFRVSGIEEYNVLFSSDEGVAKNRIRLATKEEIKSHLLKEAEERGFKLGVKYKSAFDGLNNGIIEGMFVEENFDNTWCVKDECHIWVYNGSTDKWAEIIPQEKKLFFGDVEFTVVEGDTCATTSYGLISKEEIKAAIHYLEHPPKLLSYSLTLHVLGEEKDKNAIAWDYVAESFIGFGCKQGALSELKSILAAFN